MLREGERDRAGIWPVEGPSLTPTLAPAEGRAAWLNESCPLAGGLSRLCLRARQRALVKEPKRPHIS